MGTRFPVAEQFQDEFFAIQNRGIAFLFNRASRPDAAVVLVLHLREDRARNPANKAMLQIELMPALDETQESGGEILIGKTIVQYAIAVRCADGTDDTLWSDL